MVRSGGPMNVSYKSIYLYANWLTEQIAGNVPLDQIVREIAGFARRHVFHARHELLPDRARNAQDGGERGPGVHGRPRAVRPVPQPSLRPLDDERLLQLRRLFQPDRPQGRRGLPRDDRLQFRRRRSLPSRHRPADGTQIPRRGYARLPRQGPPCGASRLAHRAGQSLLRPERRQPDLGPFLRRGDRRTGGRRPRRAIRRSIPNCISSSAANWSNTSTTSSGWCATSASRRRTSGRRSRTPATKAISGISPMPASAACRPR